jgi:hypothetical protein
VVLIARPSDMPDCVVVQLNGRGDSYYISKTQLMPAQLTDRADLGNLHRTISGVSA